MTGCLKRSHVTRTFQKIQALRVALQIKNNNQVFFFLSSHMWLQKMLIKKLYGHLPCDKYASTIICTLLILTCWRKAWAKFKCKCRVLLNEADNFKRANLNQTDRQIMR